MKYRVKRVIILTLIHQFHVSGSFWPFFFTFVNDNCHFYQKIKSKFIFDQKNRAKFFTCTITCTIFFVISNPGWKFQLGTTLFKHRLLREINGHNFWFWYNTRASYKTKNKYGPGNHCLRLGFSRNSAWVLRFDRDDEIDIGWVRFILRISWLVDNQSICFIIAFQHLILNLSIINNL